MSEHLRNQTDTTRHMAFPLVIAMTALVLSLISGVVNYRQNNLANLESSLRDTRDQLQLAKNDITDIRMKTMQQLVDAELAVKSQGQLQQDKARLREKLHESAIRMKELEVRIRRMDKKISDQAVALRSAHKKTVTSTKKSSVGDKKTSSRSNASANVDVYIKHMKPAKEAAMIAAMIDAGFTPKRPKLLASMRLSVNTTVFYYDARYKAIAQNMVRLLKGQGDGEVSLRQGASPYAKNKIIIHAIGQ